MHLRIGKTIIIVMKKKITTKRTKTVKKTASVKPITKNTLVLSKSTNLKKTLSKFENQVIMDKLDALLRLVAKLERRVMDLEEINLNYLSVIEQMSDSLNVLAGEMLDEVNKSDSVEKLLALPSSKKNNFNN